MSGRPKQVRYQYSKDGKFLNQFDSETDVRKKYYSNDKGKRPLFGTKGYIKEYHILPDNTFLTKERIGRTGIREINKRIDSKLFLDIDNNDTKIKVFNLDNKIIASFVSIKIASKMTNIPFGTIYSQLKDDRGKFTHSGLIFKYDK